MEERTATVDVCIATYRRAHMLRDLLQSIAQQRRNANLHGRIVVVDNDSAYSARDVVEAFRSRSPLPVVYAMEPRRGVAHVRNRALALSTADFTAFVDDDEVVGPDWLTALVDTAFRYQADVVFGPVLSRLPANAPAWIGKSGLFTRRRSATGSPRTTGGAGNVLLSRAILARAERGFDPAYGLSGGEDTEFFSFLGRIGGRLVWCDEAVAWETVTENRSTLRWLLRRNYSAGRVYNRIFLPSLPVREKVASAALSLSGLVVLGLTTPLALLAGRHVAARVLMKLTRCLGRITSMHYAFRTNKARI